jgi:hypothetical protein
MSLVLAFKASKKYIEKELSACLNKINALKKNKLLDSICTNLDELIKKLEVLKKKVGFDIKLSLVH